MPKKTKSATPAKKITLSNLNTSYYAGCEAMENAVFEEILKNTECRNHMQFGTANADYSTTKFDKKAISDELNKNFIQIAQHDVFTKSMEVGVPTLFHTNKAHDIYIKTTHDFESKHVKGIEIFYDDVKKIESLLEVIRSSKINEKDINGEAEIGYLISAHGEIRLEFRKFKPKSIPSLEENYGAGITKVHERIVEFVKSQDSGILILDGAPGTGKSSYITYLMANNRETKFVYIPNKAVSIMTSPQFLPFAVEELKDKIIVLEDAEDVVAERTSNADSPVSIILNLSDGILGECLKLKFIITYNTSDKVDDAVLRKGRLKYKHTFKKLSIKDAQFKLEKMGIANHKVTEPMSLADIYNINKDNISDTAPVETKKIGFV